MVGCHGLGMDSEAPGALQPMNLPSGPLGKESAILYVLLSGGSLTQLDAWHMFNASRLAAVIHKLRSKRQLEIESGWHVSTKGTRYKRYWIPQHVLKQQARGG
jgi:hypothetical protein